jgi:hypothetical protein
MSGKGGAGLLGRLRGGSDDSGGALWIEELGQNERADFGRLKRELRVLEAAQDDGRRNQPPASAATPTGTELQIVGRVAQGLRDVNAALAHALGEAAAAAGRRVPPALTPDHARAEIDSRIGHVLAEHRTDLVALREEELETQRDLNYFRRRHNLHRAASYRESTLLPFAILVGAFVIESFANAFLLRRISEQGWVGGVVLAAVISIVNISLGVVGGGVGWRLVGHRFPVQKALGWVVSVGALVLAFFWNIYAAHFREVAEAAVDTGTNANLAGHAVDALAHIRAHGILGLTSLFSWGLFALGLLVHLAASREAWDDMADRYWDYRRYDRSYRTARLDYEDAVASARADAVEASREVLAGLEAQYAPASHDRDRLLALAELAQRRLAEGRDAEAEWVRQGGAMVKAYRDENAQVRSDPAPAYFIRPVPPDAYRLGVSGAVPAAAAELEASRANAERAEAAIRADADRAAHVHADNLTALAGLKAYVTEAADALQGRIDTLKSTIDREADANLNRRAIAPDAEPGPTAEPPPTSGPWNTPTGAPHSEAPRHLESDPFGPLERVGGP